VSLSTAYTLLCGVVPAFHGIQATALHAVQEVYEQFLLQSGAPAFHGIQATALHAVQEVYEQFLLQSGASDEQGFAFFLLLLIDRAGRSEAPVMGAGALAGLLVAWMSGLEPIVLACVGA
jgi:hypothetical protein